MQPQLHKNQTEDITGSIPLQKGIGCQNLNMTIKKRNNRENGVRKTQISVLDKKGNDNNTADGGTIKTNSVSEIRAIG